MILKCKTYVDGVSYQGKDGQVVVDAAYALCMDVTDHPNWEVVSINNYTEKARTSPDRDIRGYTLFYTDALDFNKDYYE